MNEPIVLVGVAAIVALVAWPGLRWIFTWEPRRRRAPRRQRRLGQRVRRKISKKWKWRRRGVMRARGLPWR